MANPPTEEEIVDRCIARMDVIGASKSFLVSPGNDEIIFLKEALLEYRYDLVEALSTDIKFHFVSNPEVEIELIDNDDCYFSINPYEMGIMTKTSFPTNDPIVAQTVNFRAAMTSQRTKRRLSDLIVLLNDCIVKLDNYEEYYDL